MSTLARSGFVLAACALAAFAWWASVGDVLPPASAVVAGANQSAASPVTADHERDRGAERAVVASEAPDVLVLSQPYEFELRARVVDADGLPVDGGHIALAPPSCALALSEQMLGGDGRVVVKWRGHVKQLTMALGYAYQYKTSSLQQVTVVADVPADVSFVAGPAPLPTQVTVDALGRQIFTMPECGRKTKADCRSCHEPSDGPKMFDVRGVMRAGLHPDAVFGDRLAIAPPEPDAWQVGVMTSGSGIAPTLKRAPRDRVVEGRLFGADGSPAGGVTVLYRRNGGWFGRVRTNRDGSFRWTGVDPGTIDVIAGGGPQGQARRSLDVIAGQITRVELLLEAGRTLRGHVRGAGGKSLNGARVEYVAPAGYVGDIATVGPDGEFAFANLPPGPGRLLVWGIKGEKLPIAEEASVLPDAADIEIDLRQRAAVNGELRVFVRGHDGETPQDIEVRCWQQQTKRGAFLDRREDGAFHAHGMMAGFYRVEVGTLATGFHDLGVHWIDGAGLADLGTVQLPQPARLHVETDAAPDVLELYAVRADVDVRADEIVPWTSDVLLPPGRWVALWKRDGKVAVREFALEAGATTTLRTDR